MLKRKSPQQYIRSKLASEKLFFDYPDVPSIILRPRGLFGVGIPVFCLVSYASVEKIGIPLIRGGEQLMDMTRVENVASHSRLWQKKHGQVYNITNENQRPLSIWSKQH